jgi:hypothetical protein
MLRTEVENIFDSLRLRERRVLQLRFGLIDGQREQVRSLSRDRPVDTAACLRPGPVITPVAGSEAGPQVPGAAPPTAQRRTGDLGP